MDQIELLLEQHRPIVDDVHALLRKRNSLVVHFSGAPPGAGRTTGRLYPNDLRYVLSGSATGGISCSTVTAADVFHERDRNATGCIGVIVDFRTPHSIIYAFPEDHGSFQQDDGSRGVQKIRPLSIGDIAKSIDDRDAKSYNEWVIRDFDCVGILAVEPYEISTLAPYPAHISTSDSVPGVLRTSLPDVCRDFPGQNVYSFNDGRIIDVRERKVVDISDIYRCK